MERISGIYKITNIINNKVYVGKSVHCYERFYKHKNALRNNRHGNIHLQRAWEIYGEDNFTFEIIERCGEKVLLIKEDYWCKELKSHDREIGYNIDPTGDTWKPTLSQETIEKIRIANTGKKATSEALEKMRNNRKNLLGVDQYDIKGNFLTSFISMREAERQTGISSRGIKGCITGEYNIVKCFIFKNKGEELTKEEIERRNINSHEGKKVKIIGYTLEGKLIGKFNSMSEAGRYTNTHHQSISRCLLGETKHGNNIIWIKQED